eukprot:evm.model.NODE_10827_length_17461_cov_27.031786.1
MGGGDTTTPTYAATAASLIFLSAATVATFALYTRKHKKTAFFRGTDRLPPPNSSTTHSTSSSTDTTTSTGNAAGLAPIKYKSVKDCELSAQLNIKDLECAHIHQANLLEITNLGRTFKGANVQNLSQMSSTTSGESIAYNKLLGHQDGIIADIVRREGLPPETKVYVRAGPRKELHFEPEKVRAAIVTCGGLCPGLNNVIRELVNSLFHLYKAQ